MRKEDENHFNDMADAAERGDRFCMKIGGRVYEIWDMATFAAAMVAFATIGGAITLQ